MNKKCFKSFLCVAVILVMMSACGKQKAVDPSLLKSFVGEWHCAETPSEHEDYYTGFLTLRIHEDGSFSMYDAEAGNPGISGKLANLSDTELVLNCNAEDDFDPPPTWENMSEKQAILYKFVSEYELHMMFENDGNVSTLVFRMDGADVSVDTFVFMKDKFTESDAGNLFYVPSVEVEEMNAPELYLMNHGLLLTEVVEAEESTDLVLKRISLEDGSLCGDNRFAVSDDAKIQFGEGYLVLHDETMDSIWVMDDSLQVVDSGTVDSECGNWYLEQEWSDGLAVKSLEDQFSGLYRVGSKLLSVNEEENIMSLYELDGEYVSRCSLSSDTQHQMSDNLVWSGYWQGYFFVDTTADGSRLLFWDPAIPTEGENLPINLEELENEPVFTMDDLKEKADELSEKYGLNIRVGDDCDLNYAGYSASLYEEEEKIADSLEVLASCLENYPEGFMEQLLFGAIESIRIELVDNLKLRDGVDAVDAAGFVEEREDYIVVVLEADFLSATSVYHELTHVIDKRLEWDMNTKNGALFSEKEWLKLQPVGFDYAYSYNQIPVEVEAFYGSEAFVSEYACTYPTEDRATMMESAMTGQKDYFTDNEALCEKLKYYSECIRDSFDTVGWPEVTMWEKFL